MTPVFKPLERGLGDLPDVLRPAVEPGLHLAGFKTELRGDHDLVAEGRQGLAHQFLVRERTVGLGGVEEGDAALEGRPDQRDRLLPVGRRAVTIAEPHAAEADRRDFQTAVAEFAFLHCCFSILVDDQPCAEFGYCSSLTCSIQSTGLPFSAS